VRWDLRTGPRSLAVALFAVVSAFASAQAPAPTPPSDLQGEFAASVKAFMDEYRAADEKARPALLADPIREPRHRFTPLFLAEAERKKGTAGALSYWTRTQRSGSIVF
jgi:hypothetical protein